MFREAVPLLMRLWSEDAPALDSPLAFLHGEDVVPKPLACRVPVLVTGRAQQTLEWIAGSTDGWVTYPRAEAAQIATVELWRRSAAKVAPGVFKPFAQSLYVDVVADPDARPTPIHLGYRLGAIALRELLARLEDAGVHHVILNLKYGSRPVHAVLDDLDAHVIGHFPAHRIEDDTTTRIDGSCRSRPLAGTMA